MAWFYPIGKALCRCVRFTCVRCVTLRAERFDREGGFVLAVTHLSHLDPMLIASGVDRRIDFMARIEFYRSRIARVLLDGVDAFPVNRQGVPVAAIRTAIERVRHGSVVGIFPEGGVARGSESVMLGGPIKRGACVVAQRSGAPILPVALVGSEDICRVTPWLPFRRIKLYVIFGNAIVPRLDQPRRAERFRMADELAAEFTVMYRELSAACGCAILNARVIAHGGAPSPGTPAECWGEGPRGHSGNWQGRTHGFEPSPHHSPGMPGKGDNAKCGGTVFDTPARDDQRGEPTPG